MKIPVGNNRPVLPRSALPIQEDLERKCHAESLRWAERESLLDEYRLNADGILFNASVSRAVRRVGWVIHYEQTKMLSRAMHR